MSDFTERVFDALKAGRRTTKEWGRRWRRARVARSRSRSKQTYLLILLLIVLAGTFAKCLDYLAPTSEGQRISVSAFSELAKTKRLVTAEFRDEDSRIVGTARCAPAQSGGP